MKGTCGKVLSMVVVCTFAMLWTARARAQTDPVAQDVICPNNMCNGTNATWDVLTSQNLPTLEFANSGGAETGTAYLVVLVPSATDLGLSFSANGTTATDAGVWSGSPSSTIFGFLNVATAGNLGGFDSYTVGGFSAFAAAAPPAPPPPPRGGPPPRAGGCPGPPRLRPGGPPPRPPPPTPRPPAAP